MFSLLQFESNDRASAFHASCISRIRRLFHLFQGHNTSLKKDNSTRTGRYKAVFVAEENIRLYIARFGEPQIGLLTVTTPSPCLQAFEFQRMWHSFQTHAVKDWFKTGMWVRERQPRSGNWHAHAVVNVGWDIKTAFPFAQVESAFYANVEPRLRELWKELRERGAAHGFGRIELLPLKHSGPACARYLTKYLGKAFSTEKSEGEEKCRLFGVSRRLRQFGDRSLRSSKWPSTPSPPQPPPSPASERLAYSIKEAAALLGVEYFSIYRLIQRGKLHACIAHLEPSIACAVAQVFHVSDDDEIACSEKAEWPRRCGNSMRAKMRRAIARRMHIIAVV